MPGAGIAMYVASLPNIRADKHLARVASLFRSVSDVRFWAAGPPRYCQSVAAAETGRRNSAERGKQLIQVILCW